MSTTHQLLIERFPEIAALLLQRSSAKYTPVATRDGKENLADQSCSPTYYVHPNYSIEKELQRWQASLDLEGVSQLFVYGLGVGYALDGVRDWLEKDTRHTLIFLERDLDLIKAFLDCSQALKVLKHPQVEIEYLPSQRIHNPLLWQEIAVRYFGKQSLLSALPHTLSQKAKDCQEVFGHINESFTHLEHVQPELLSYGQGFFQNFYANILQASTFQALKKLPPCFKGVPAIICGAGPSLKKQIPLLKELGDKALILTGGSGIPALSHLGIEPHFGMLGDPSPKMEKKLLNHKLSTLPTFIKPRLYPGALRTVKGPRLYLPGCPTYPVADFIDRQVGLDGIEVPEGCNVLHVLAHLCGMLGCSPILFVGLDLAYTDNLAYTGGVLSGQESQKEAHVKGQSGDNQLIEVKDIFGNPVHTLPKWILEAKHSSLLPSLYPRSQFLNATEGGMGVENISNASLREVVESQIHEQRNIRELVDTTIHSSDYFQQASGEGIGALKQLRKELDTVIRLCEELLKINGKILKKLQAGKLFQIQGLLEKFIALKEELADLEAYKTVVYPLTILHRQLISQQKKGELRQAVSENMKQRVMAEIDKEEISVEIKATQANIEALESALNASQHEQSLAQST